MLILRVGINMIGCLVHKEQVRVHTYIYTLRRWVTHYDKILIEKLGLINHKERISFRGLVYNKQVSTKKTISVFNR